MTDDSDETETETDAKPGEEPSTAKRPERDGESTGKSKPPPIDDAEAINGANS